MNGRAWSLVCVFLMATGTARADDCSAASVAKARAAADKLLKAGKAKAARAQLDEVASRCAASLKGDQARLWLLSDRAYAAYKAGDAEGCSQILGDELSEEMDEVTRNPKVGKALLYNAELCKPRPGGCDYKLDHDVTVCRIKLAMEYSERNEIKGFLTVACPLKGHEEGIRIDGGGKPVCLEPDGFKKVSDDEIVCADFYLIEEGKPRTKLALEKDTWLNSPSDCCNARHLGVKREKGKVSVLVSSEMPSRDCFGGTATTDYLTVFDFDGKALTGGVDYGVSWH